MSGLFGDLPIQIREPDGEFRELAERQRRREAQRLVLTEAAWWQYRALLDGAANVEPYHPPTAWARSGFPANSNWH